LLPEIPQMNRRSFLGFLGLAPAVAALPAVANVPARDRALFAGIDLSGPKPEISLVGAMFSREQVRALIRQINETQQ
jgi:hypothetical protein